MITDGLYTDVAYCDFDNEILLTIKQLPKYEEMLAGKYDVVDEE